MLEYVIYGKIIIDDIYFGNDDLAHRVLGGGGPQASFGARLWSRSVGLLTRSGDDLEPGQVDALTGTGVDLRGWRRFPGIATPYSRMAYDQNEYVLDDGLISSRASWFHLLDQPLPLPRSYSDPRAIHLITEFPDEPMVHTALEMRARGALLSLEPLPFAPIGKDRNSMIGLLQQVDIVTPDWPTASGLAGSEEPREVIRYWKTLGPDVIAVRHGANGSYIWSRAHDQVWHVPAVPARVVDPTGAGNAFGGGLCVGWSATRDPRHAAAYGAISAAFQVRTIGVPTMSNDLEGEANALLDAALATARPL